MVRRPPAQLFRHFKTESFGPFGVIGTHVDVDKGPFEGIGNLGAELVHLIVIAVDADNRGAVNPGAHHFARLQIRRDEDERPHLRVRTIGRGGAGEVPRGSAGDRIKTQLAGAGKSG